MMKIFKYIYYKTYLGKGLIFIYHNTKNRIVPNKIFLKYKYKRNFGVFPNLDNPKTLNEKIIWLKLNDRTPLHTQCADKYEVRSFVSEKIRKEYLVPLFFHTQNPKEITPENIPDIPCVVKTNHDSGSVFFVRDKNQVNWTDLQKQLKSHLKNNYYWQSKEWQYKNIKPRIIVEKLLLDKNGNIPFDYKLHCFNGKVNMIQVDIGRGSGHHYRNWYSTAWEREPYRWSSPKGNGIYTDPSKDDVPKPQNLDKMIELSEKLAQSFRYVRVDWYDMDGQLYFGEITFHHDGGNQKILPEIWDKKLGDLLRL